MQAMQKCIVLVFAHHSAGGPAFLHRSRVKALMSKGITEMTAMEDPAMETPIIVGVQEYFNPLVMDISTLGIFHFRYE
jgi:hypothetical protein